MHVVEIFTISFSLRSSKFSYDASILNRYPSNNLNAYHDWKTRLQVFVYISNERRMNNDYILLVTKIPCEAALCMDCTIDKGNSIKMATHGIVETIYCLLCIGFCNGDSIQFRNSSQMNWLDPSFLGDFIWAQPSSCSSFIYGLYAWIAPSYATYRKLFLPFAVNRYVGSTSNISLHENASGNHKIKLFKLIIQIVDYNTYSKR